MKKLSIIIPCYQSQKDFDNLISELARIIPLIKTKVDLEFVLVDDGSTDESFLGMLEFKKQYPFTKLVKLTGNFGSHAAFLAGIKEANGDCFAQLHPDLQDPPEHLPQMIDYWLQGWLLVIGQRVKREEGLIKRTFSLTYHWLIKKIAMPHIPKGGYDLILFDKRIRDEIVKMNEPNISLVYLISSLKHPYVTIPVTRVKNKHGQSTWTFDKNVKLLIDSIVGFSYFPIRFISFLASCVGLFFCFLSVELIYMTFCHTEITIFFKILYVISFFSSILALMLAVIGEYLWRTLEAARKRPLYIVDQIIE